MWNDKDFDFFFICLSIFNFHFYLKNELRQSTYKFLENLDEERPYLILQHSTHGNFSNGEKLVIKTFGNLKSFEDIDIIRQNPKYEFISFKKFTGKFFFF